jgi:hypothetical protein
MKKAATVRMVRAPRTELGTERGTAQRVALHLGFGVKSVRSWVGQADIDGGLTGALSSAGVELICRVSQVATNTYSVARDRAPSTRPLLHAVLSG